MPDRPRTRTPLVVAGLLALLATVAAGVLATPVTVLFPPQVAVLEPGGFWHDQGSSYCHAVPFDTPSDQGGGTSRLELHEDGVPLPPHVLHQTLREDRGGGFSHWGGQVYVSPSDDSDPRDNGRRYEFVLPADAPTAIATLPLAVAVAGAALATLLLLLAWIVPSWRAPGVLTVVLVAASLAGLALVAPEAASWWTRRAMLDAAPLDEPIASDAVAVRAGAPADAPRTLRLLDDDGTPPRFEATAPAPVPLEPLVVPLTPPDDAEQLDGLVRLPRGAMLASTAPIAVEGRAVGEIVLPVTIHGGEVLRLELLGRDTDGEARLVRELELPVAPADEEQVLRIERPVGPQTRSVITGVRLGNPPGAAGDLLLRAGKVTLADARAVYTRSDHGRAVMDLSGGRRPAWWQSASGAFTVDVPAGPRRAVRGGVELLAAGAESRATVELVLEGEGEPVVRTAVLDPASPRTRFDLEGPAGLRRVRLVGRDLGPGDVLAWSGLRAVDTARPARRVVFTLIDTLRSDLLFSELTATPALDRLAAEGAAFARCYSQAHWTRPSMTSLMTGHYTAAAGVHGSGHQLPGTYGTLAEAFAAGGFHTAAFISNTNAGPDAGLEQGWDELVVDLDFGQRTDDFLARHVEPRVEALADDDLFLYLHLMEVHGPYGPPERPEGWEPPAGEPIERDATLDRPWLEVPTAEARRALYCYDLEQTDRALGAFLDRWLTRWEQGDHEPVVVAVASDHGEMLGEHGRWSHRSYPYVPELIQVPFLLRAPGRFPPGPREEVIENLDVAPTLLDLAGLLDGAGRFGSGRSLLPLLVDGRSDDHGTAISSTEAPRHFAVYDRRGGLVGEHDGLLGFVGPAGDFAPVRAEPERAWELLERHVDAGFRAVWEAFRAHQLERRDRAWAEAGERGRAIDPAALEQLREMGYLGH